MCLLFSNKYLKLAASTVTAMQGGTETPVTNKSLGRVPFVPDLEPFLQRRVRHDLLSKLVFTLKLDGLAGTYLGLSMLLIEIGDVYTTRYLIGLGICVKQPLIHSRILLGIFPAKHCGNICLLR